MTAFPDDFVWGVATSAFQIEGAGGRGESIWDRFARQPGAIVDGSDGSVACGHHQRWREDVELMRWLGVGAYRFSIAWPRVLPEGRGRVSEQGLDFYDALVDGLLDAGIRPMVTLYHWDLPQVFEDAGGWPDRATAAAFVEYTDVVSRRLGDRVTQWITHNEPWCVSELGYARGHHAPGRTDAAASLAAAHHVLLSHGWATAAIRANARDAEVGITLNLVPVEPASDSDADADASRESDGRFNRWFLDPLHGRGYPDDVVADHVRAGRLDEWPAAFVRDGDLAAIAATNDFLGVNYYSRAVVRSSHVAEEANAPRTVHESDDQTDMGWEVYPEGLVQLLVRLRDDYAPPAVYITENGAAYGTPPCDDGRVRDVRRQQYLRSHMEATGEAIAQGVPVRGYFVWSLLDNFEWAYGYTRRFGVVWTDYDTLERIPKDSAHYCRRVFSANAVVDVTP